MILTVVYMIVLSLQKANQILIENQNLYLKNISN